MLIFDRRICPESLSVEFGYTLYNYNFVKMLYFDVCKCFCVLARIFYYRNLFVLFLYPIQTLKNLFATLFSQLFF
jgi:hypothetical protein